ncbi:epoxyqueuosine reductase, partial [Candidatus Bathyarchaeota archaeon]|nr:epoxyqueuosine reductase [Candidatus Bathyarchaeota archaeon]
MTILKELHEYAKNLGVDMFGVADLTSVRGFVKAQGGEYVSSFPRAISLGMRLLDSVVDELYHHDDIVTLATYRGLYTAVNAALDRAALMLGKRIQDLGFKAYPIQASQIVDPLKLEGVFSHKLAANLAGLGWIGKSCLLVTPECGPRVRLATILTDAPLDAGKPMENRCGVCRRCVDVCPTQAFTGAAFNTAEPREARFKAKLCEEYTDNRISIFGDINCGLCVYVCP